VKNIDWHLIPDYIRFKAFEQTKRYGVRTAIVITGVKVAAGFVVLVSAALTVGNSGMVRTVNDSDKPVNTPSYASVTHRQAASMVCEVETGNAGLRQASPSVWAAYVVVVRLDGTMQRMDTTEAWDRAESETRADDIWVIGVCAGDIVREDRAA
jgi:hypothetical protein